MILDRLPPRSEWLQLVRYYVAAAINLMFGYVLFAGLVWAGLQVFVAQALGYVVGVMFNYVTYSRIAFTGQHGGRTSFVAAYVLNYLLSVAFLWLALKVHPSPYLAGLAVTFAVSLVNYLVLKRWVFRAPAKV
jgi:putative flippase GtrA